MECKNLKSMGCAAFITASALIGAPTTMNFEGMKLAPYYDSVGVKTWCVGETEVGEKEKFNPDECKLMYNIRYGFYSMAVTKMYNERGTENTSPEMHAAFVDMAYNVGIDAVSNSTMIREVNAGNKRKACDGILLYKKAGGVDCSKPGNKICPGVWTRRLQMNELCKKGIK